MTDRVSTVSVEIANLGANMLADVLSPTLAKMLAGREAEKGRIEEQLRIQPPTDGIVLPAPPDLTKLYEEKAADVANALDTEAARAEAAEILATLIEGVTTYAATDGSVDAEVSARAGDLVAFATNGNAVPGSGVSSSTKIGCGDPQRTQTYVGNGVGV